MKRKRLLMLSCACAALALGAPLRAVIVTDPNDARTWQGASVGTFAALFYGSDTPANRQLVVDNMLLDDGIFDPSGYTPGILQPTPWALGGGGGCLGRSLDLSGSGTYDYVCDGTNVFTQANTVDNLWFQSSGAVGDTVFDLGAPSMFAGVFGTIDHGPLPQEAIESTVYLSNDLINWTQASVRRVFLEGYNPNLGILWDGFTYVVGTPNNDPFQYASIIHGGPGALWNDGDDEINGLLGLNVVPEPGALFLLTLGGLLVLRRR